jgi:hypothetical protein
MRTSATNDGANVPASNSAVANHDPVGQTAAQKKAAHVAV